MFHCTLFIFSPVFYSGGPCTLLTTGQGRHSGCVLVHICGPSLTPSDKWYRKGSWRRSRIKRSKRRIRKKGRKKDDTDVHSLNMHCTNYQQTFYVGVLFCLEVIFIKWHHSCKTFISHRYFHSIAIPVLIHHAWYVKTRFQTFPRDVVVIQLFHFSNTSYWNSSLILDVPLCRVSKYLQLPPHSVLEVKNLLLTFK